MAIPGQAQVAPGLMPVKMGYAIKNCCLNPSHLNVPGFECPELEWLLYLSGWFYVLSFLIIIHRVFD